MYISRSTSPPKGVIILHKNIVVTSKSPQDLSYLSSTYLYLVASVDLVVSPYISATDTLLTYLPLAHVFEFMFENAFLY